jgi:hypothetical protein
MAQALAGTGIHLDTVGPLRQRLQLAFKAKQLLYRELLGRRHMRDWEPTITRGYATQVNRAVRQLNPDVLFFPGTSLPALSRLPNGTAAVAWCDATFPAMVDYYPPNEPGDVHAPGWSGLSSPALRHGMEGEAIAMRKCALLVFTSRWAAGTAIRSYGIDPTKVRIAPFGANLSTCRSADEVQQIVAKRPRDACRLLFLGGEWRRKGGPMALQVAERLNGLGLPTQLTIAGCKPQIPLPPFVRVEGFLDKGLRQGEARLAQLLEESHFLILPSLADCTPIAFSEANSRGVPCLARETGGIPEIITDGRNGKLFSPASNADDWAAFVITCLTDWPAYLALAQSSFCEYEARLSWSRNARAVAGWIRDLFEPPRDDAAAATER